ncbi:MAG: hypothetical protein ACRDDX_12800 [Cellulosilyticaceae bacterium]
MAVNNVKNYSYQYGTEAPKYPYGVPNHTETPDFQPLRRPSKKSKPKVDIAHVIKLTTCGAALFIAAISFVHLTSELATKQRRLEQITSQIRETQSAINSMQAIIASQLDLDAIQKVAQTQLGMAEPLPHQVVYLELPQESYTVYNE